jgi:hypothetical protein
MKSNLLKIATMIVALATPGLSLAAWTTQITTSATTILGSQTITPSNNVVIGVSSNGTIYAAKSAHTKGDRIFGINSSDTKIYYYTVSGNIDPTTDGTNWGTSASSIDFTGWSSL